MGKRKSNASVEKSKRLKQDKDATIRSQIMQELRDKSKDVLLPEMRNKVEELSKYIEQRLEKGQAGLTSAQIMPLLARRSLLENAFAGNISYTAQEMAIGFDLYIQALQKINEYTKFPPSKQSFCLFMGISSSTYTNYLQDTEKCEIMRIIDDYITSNKIISAQLGEIREISSIFELKSQHHWVEAQAPVVIQHEKKESIEDIQAKIASIKGKVIEADYEEDRPNK